jgi:hypothetical protein
MVNCFSSTNPTLAIEAVIILQICQLSPYYQQ